MATKVKAKPKVAKSTSLKAKTTNAAKRAGPARGKLAKPPVARSANNAHSRAKKAATKVAPRRAPVVAPSTLPQWDRSEHFANAIQAYEAGIRLMHAEQLDKAIRRFSDLIASHPDEPEIQDRAKVLLHVCEKKLNEKQRAVLSSSDDHYDVGIAHLNRRQLDSALQHLQQALKMSPKGDHILYALGAANALQGNRDQALTYLQQSIQYRPENRFLAARDSDFEALQDDSDFKQLITPAEK